MQLSEAAAAAASQTHQEQATPRPRGCNGSLETRIKCFSQGWTGVWCEV